MAYFTRSRALTEHKAAGVLPFCLHEGAVLVLLGAEPCRTGPGGKVCAGLACGCRLCLLHFHQSSRAVQASVEATAPCRAQTCCPSLMHEHSCTEPCGATLAAAGRRRRVLPLLLGAPCLCSADVTQE